MRLEINAGGLNQFFSNVSSFVNANTNSPSTALIASLQTVIDRTNNLQGGAGSLSSVVQFVRTRRTLEETRRIRIQTVQRKTNEFIDIARDTDNRVAALLKVSNEAFYSVNPWARPPASGWSRFWNSVGNGARTIWDWTSDTVSNAWNGIVDWYKNSEMRNIIKGIGTLLLLIAINPIAAAAYTLYQTASIVGRLTYGDDKESVFNSVISNYRGQITIRAFDMGGSAASIGPIMLLCNSFRLDRDQRERERALRILNHEHGHFIDYKSLGAFRYYVGMGLPSIINAARGVSHLPLGYYEQPWEARADINADAFGHTPENIARANAYYEHIKSLNGLGWFRFLTKDLWDFIEHDFSALEGEG